MSAAAKGIDGAEATIKVLRRTMDRQRERSVVRGTVGTCGSSIISLCAIGSLK
jgi:hypothetical protein